MIKKTHHIFLFLLSISLISCSSAGGQRYHYQNFIDSEDSGLVFFYRLDGVDSNQYPAIYVDDKKLGVLKYNGYLVAVLEPGDYQVLLTQRDSQAKWYKSDINRRIKLAAGTRQYYRLSLEYAPDTFMLELVKTLQFFTPVDPLIAERELSRTRLSE